MKKRCPFLALYIEQESISLFCVIYKLEMGLLISVGKNFTNVWHVEEKGIFLLSNASVGKDLIILLYIDQERVFLFCSSLLIYWAGKDLTTVFCNMSMRKIFFPFLNISAGKDPTILLYIHEDGIFLLCNISLGKDFIILWYKSSRKGFFSIL